jgi:flagellar protein FliL
MMRYRFTALLLLLVCMLVRAADPGADKAQYVYIQPAFVLNYGEAGNRLKYIRTDVALRVTGTLAAERVNYHAPYIRNQLVFLLSQQPDEVVNNAKGREVLRKEALDAVRELLTELEGKPYVDDLYFQNFVAQN